MNDFFNVITEINNVINRCIWNYGLAVLIAAGIISTLATRVFQITHLKEWTAATTGTLFKRKGKEKSDKGSVSQFQALCTALAATIGTGNIAGVAAAVAAGGPGAVFWMWVAAFFGMMTNFSENVLGIYYRRKNEKGEWSGGPMYYLRDGLGSYKHCGSVGKLLAVFFSVCTILASFGIGNIGQINKITVNLESAFLHHINAGCIFGGIRWTSLIIGIVLMIVAGIIIFGGIQRIASAAEKLVPFMACAYILGCLAIFLININKTDEIFASVFRFAFGAEAVAGGFAGIAVKEVITQGCKRGVFSNEAGLGSSVIIHTASSVKEPVVQGMWGIFEVFADTMVVCTMTAVVVLSSGAINLETGEFIGENADTLVAQSFGNVFGTAGEIFIALCILMFAFTTVLGWSHYGIRAVEYLFGLKAGKIYKGLFVAVIVTGAIMTSDTAWNISDTFNGMMMIPNLTGVLMLMPLVVRITRNYTDRKIKKKEILPMISAIPEIQNMYAADIISEDK